MSTKFIELDSSGRRKFIKIGAIGGGLAAFVAAEKSSAQSCVSGSTSASAFNVRDYCAVGDGVVDDAVAIQSAIDAAATAGGGVVYFPPGRYLIGTTINLLFPDHLPNPEHRNISLEGAGLLSSVILIPSEATFDGVLVSGWASRLRLLTIASDTPRANGAAVRIAPGTPLVVVEDVHIHLQKIGLHIQAGGIYVNRCAISQPSPNGAGVMIDGNIDEVHLTHVSVGGQLSGSPAPASDNVFGFHVRRGSGIYMHECISMLCSMGLVIDPPAGSVVQWCFFSNCAWDSSGSHGMLIATTSGLIRSLNFTNCWTATNGSASSPANGCVVAGNVDGCEFIGHRFVNNTYGNGLYVVTPAINVSADACQSSGHPGNHGFCFVGASKFSVRNCTSGPYGTFVANGYGVTITSGSSNYIVTNNVLAGNTVAPISDSGAMPKIVGQNL